MLTFALMNLIHWRTPSKAQGYLPGKEVKVFQAFRAFPLHSIVTQRNCKAENQNQGTMEFYVTFSSFCYSKMH